MPFFSPMSIHINPCAIRGHDCIVELQREGISVAFLCCCISCPSLHTQQLVVPKFLFGLSRRELCWAWQPAVVYTISNLRLRTGCIARLRAKWQLAAPARDVPAAQAATALCEKLSGKMRQTSFRFGRDGNLNKGSAPNSFSGACIELSGRQPPSMMSASGQSFGSAQLQTRIYRKLGLLVRS